MESSNPLVINVRYLDILRQTSKTFIEVVKIYISICNTNQTRYQGALIDRFNETNLMCSDSFLISY